MNITVKSGDNKSQLLTFKVGNTTLTVDETTGVISGELPFSATTDKVEGLADATFVDFTTDSYARLMAEGDITARLFSNGDINEDGLVDDIDASSATDNTFASNGDYKGFNNFKLAFERVENDPKQPVKVYLVWALMVPTQLRKLLSSGLKPKTA